MRIVSGMLRGRKVDAPSGSGTRPTTDRVREALFSSLYSYLGGFDGAVVLDAFAGSGALGIEAISRGAERAVFYENDRGAVRALRDNLKSCGLVPPRAVLMERDVVKTPPSDSSSPFDLVFLDPPYRFDPVGIMRMLADMASVGAVSPGALIVYEHSLKSADEVAGAFESINAEVVTAKKYGKTGITTGIISG